MKNQNRQRNVAVDATGIQSPLLDSMVAVEGLDRDQSPVQDAVQVHSPDADFIPLWPENCHYLATLLGTPITDYDDLAAAVKKAVSISMLGVQIPLETDLRKRVQGRLEHHKSKEAWAKGLEEMVVKGLHEQVGW